MATVARIGAPQAVRHVGAHEHRQAAVGKIGDLVLKKGHAGQLFFRGLEGYLAVASKGGEILVRLDQAHTVDVVLGNAAPTEIAVAAI